MKHPSITKNDLHGIWSALPTPWKENGSLDPQLYGEDITRLCKTGIHGVYSGGTTGEFYVQDFELFAKVNRVLVKTAHRYKKRVQAGCTALNTDEACKRTAFACKIGADIIQIALPFWLELDDREVIFFFEAIAKVAGQTPIVHYDTDRSKRRISPKLYREICRKVPTLWGTKFGASDLWEIRQITRENPELKVFVGEHILASATPMGVTGAYSSLVNVNPEWILEYYEACRTANWSCAFRLQDEACKLIKAIFEEIVTPNMQDTARDRILGQLAGFLKCPLKSKTPYRSATSEDLERMRAWTRKNLPHILKRGNKS